MSSAPELDWPLFDEAWYARRYPEVVRAGLDPRTHYRACGEAAGYWPNPWFDPDFVRSQSSHFDPASDRPLADYVAGSSKLGVRPHPLFDPVWYRGRYPIVERSGAEALEYFLRHGRDLGHAPNAFADPSEPYRPSDILVRFRALLERARIESQPSTTENEVLFEYLNSLSATMRDEVPAFGATDHPSPHVSIIIPTYNQSFFTLACVYSILSARTRTPYEIIVADDASECDRGRDAALQCLPNVRCVTQSANLGFLRNCNAAAREASGAFLLFLNNDTLVTDGWLDELVATFDRYPNVGIAGSKLLFPNGEVAEAGGIVWGDATPWNFGRHRAPDDPAISYAREVDYVSGASMLIPKKLFEELDGFDETFAPAYFEDTDLAFRVRDAGKRVVYQPNSEVIHFEGVSSGTDLRRGIKRYQDRNQETFSGRWLRDVSHHGVRGRDPDREKDRYANRRALIVDVCLPSPQRDARSKKLFAMMKVLRDDGYKVSFAAEIFDVDEPFLRELRGSGIEVFEPTSGKTIDAFLGERGADFDVCLLARPVVADRWLSTIEEHCTNARVKVITNLDAAPDPRAFADHATKATDVYEPVLQRPCDVNRCGIWVATGPQDDATADALLWLRDEIIPRLRTTWRSEAEPVFYFRRREWTDHVVERERQLQSVDEADLVGVTALDGFRIAIAPSRFGASLAGQLEIALSRGLPCVASPHASSGMNAVATRELVVAKTAEEFAEAIQTLLEDDTHWLAANRAAVERTDSLYPYREAVESLLTAVARGARPLASSNSANFASAASIEK